MPAYDLRCLACGAMFEVRKRVADPLPRCPCCSGVARVVILHAPAVHGRMARGREAAMRSLEPAPAHGDGCPCCH